jgi:tellurite resistance protein
MNPSANTPHERLAHVPVALFASVMGMAGLAIAWTKAHHVAGAPLEVAWVLRWMASGLYAFLLALYGAKLLRHTQAVKVDWAHSVRMNFFPAMSIGLLLLSIAWAQDAPAAAFWMWGFAAALHLAFTLAVMGSWIHQPHYTIQHANPAWFIPVVGNIIVPIAGVRFAPLDVSWFFFSIGLVFWLVLMTIVLYRLFFHEPLPARLTPTLFILIAPPAVGFLAYVELIDRLDGFARVLYFTALFLTLLLSSRAISFFRLPFFISAWAYTFPLAALTIATFEMGARSHQAFYTGLGWILLAVVSSAVGLISFKTVLASVQGKVFAPE